MRSLSEVRESIVWILKPFLIGDGAGVGMGRTVAGVILENYLRGRKKALW